MIKIEKGLYKLSNTKVSNSVHCTTLKDGLYETS